MKVRDIIKLLEQDGWYLKATRGSHRQYKHSTNQAARLCPDIQTMICHEEP